MTSAESRLGGSPSAAAGTDRSGELAVNGGRKAVESLEGHGPPKVGVEEFLALADTWGYSRRAREQMARILEEAVGEGSGASYRGYKGLVIDNSDLDAPTFLRKKAD